MAYLWGKALDDQGMWHFQTWYMGCVLGLWPHYWAWGSYLVAKTACPPNYLMSLMH